MWFLNFYVEFTLISKVAEGSACAGSDGYRMTIYHLIIEEFLNPSGS